MNIRWTKGKCFTSLENGNVLGETPLLERMIAVETQSSLQEQPCCHWVKVEDPVLMKRMD